MIGLDTSDAPLISAKTGENCGDVLEAIVRHIPAPQGDAEAPLHLTGDTTLSARWTQAEPQSAEAALLTYDPDAPITKQEAAKTLYQMARQLGLDTEAGQEVDLTQFEDADEISEDAADAVRWAYAADLLTEKDGKLHVADELTRKELTRMLEDFLDLI